ncbi:hypothetical protein SISNIDRAFT_469067 [Sistotremastrum niveocremeum HHB9708]|uniref:Uncharacterized protein n=1 Tax=Sistotremastrum niveocremeum HHB9708 TaxID=1314777 RepID=A0A164QNB8_9AGAM|nr:hypothetical protein SISNIDRAFT_469067 [Sistotremastrum niveocremeum HHB9708]
MHPSTWESADEREQSISRLRGGVEVGEAILGPSRGGMLIRVFVGYRGSNCVQQFRNAVTAAKDYKQRRGTILRRTRNRKRSRRVSRHPSDQICQWPRYRGVEDECTGTQECHANGQRNIYHRVNDAKNGGKKHMNEHSKLALHLSEASSGGRLE